MNLAASTILSASAGLVLAIGRFLLVSLIGRVYGLEAVGAFAYSIFVAEILFLLCSVGLPSVLSRYLSEYQSDDQKIASLSMLSVKWASVIVGLLLAVTYVFVVSFESQVIEFVGPSQVVFLAAAFAVFSIGYAILVGMSRFDLLLLAALVVVAPPLVCLVVATPSDVGGLLPVCIVSYAFAGILGFIQLCKNLRKGPGGSPSNSMEGVLQYGFNLWFVTIAWNVLWSRGELFFVEKYQSIASLSSYTAAITIFSAAMTLCMVLVTAMPPYLARLYGENDCRDARIVCNTSMGLLLMLATVGSGLLILFSPEITRVVFDVSSREIDKTLRALALGLPAICVMSHNSLVALETNGVFTRNLNFIGLLLFLPCVFFASKYQDTITVAFARGAFMLGLSISTL